MAAPTQLRREEPIRALVDLFDTRIRTGGAHPEPRGSAEPAGSPRRRRWVPVAIAALLGLVVGAAGSYLWVMHDQVTPVGFDSTLRSFRAAGSAGSPTATDTPAGTADGSATLEPAIRSAAVGTGRATPAPGTGAVAVTESAPVATNGSAAFTLPAEGVYAYRTSGGESISVGASHQYPARTFLSLRRLGGCQWETVHPVIKEHVDRRIACSKPGEAMLLEEIHEISFFGKSDKGDYRAEPPAVLAATSDANGSTRRATMVADDGRADMTVTFVGRQALAIGGRGVDTLHIVVDAKLSGRATGSGRFEYWLDPATGLVLQLFRDTDTMANAAFGAHVRYQEHAKFTIESLTPQT